MRSRARSQSRKAKTVELATSIRVRDYATGEREGVLGECLVWAERWKVRTDQKGRGESDRGKHPGKIDRRGTFKEYRLKAGGRGGRQFFGNCMRGKKKEEGEGGKDGHRGDKAPRGDHMLGMTQNGSMQLRKLPCVLRKFPRERQKREWGCKARTFPPAVAGPPNTLEGRDWPGRFVDDGEQR